MASIGITTYAIGVQNKVDNQNYLLNSLNNTGFIQVYNSFINENSNRYENNERFEKVFKFEDCRTGEYSTNGERIFNYIIGKIKTGSYGYEAEIINTITGSIEYNKNMEDAEVMPFFFILAIPVGDVNRGVIILQSHGIFGIKTIYQDFLSSYLKSINPDYELILGNIAPTAYIENYLREGILQKIRFFRYDIPHDISNQLGINNGVEESYEEYTINKPSGFIRNNGNRIRECIRGQRLVSNIVRLDDFEYDNVKLEFKLGRRYKTINLGNIDNLNLSEDITDLVNLIGGHPTFHSIESVLIETATGYLEEMGLISRG